MSDYKLQIDRDSRKIVKEEYDSSGKIIKVSAGSISEIGIDIIEHLQSKLQASEARVKKLEEEKGYWKAQARHAIDKSEECFRVLHAIAYPIKAMQEEAEKDGAKLNGGAAISLAKDANYLTGLAKSAIENS